MNTSHPSPPAPDALEPARAQPCEEGMDDQGEYATAMQDLQRQIVRAFAVPAHLVSSGPRLASGREALEGGLWLPLEVLSHG